MIKIGIGAAFVVIVAIVTAAHYIGKLDERVSSIEPAGIKKLVAEEVKKTMKEIRKESFVPSKAILAWAGRQSKIPEGWVICGQKGTLNMDGQFLIGTNRWNEIGTKVGSETHEHRVKATTGWEHEGKKHSLEGADNYTGRPNWNHKHQIDEKTNNVAHKPPSMKVFFLCKK